MKTIKAQVLHAIETGKIVMRPVWYFTLQAAALISGAIIVALLLLYLVSFIIFILRESGALFVPRFGIRGWFALMRASPWILIIASCICAAVLELLMRQFGKNYRQPIIYPIIAAMIIAVIGGVFIAHTSFHHRLSRAARGRNIPLADSLYRRFSEEKFENITVGEIVEKRNDGFIVKDRHDEFLNITIDNVTRVLDKEIKPGDRVVIFGNRSNDTIQAMGIRKIDNEE